MQGIPPYDYFRFYYQLHKDVDAELLKVYNTLRQSRFFDDTIIVFTSDHGDLLGAHRYMHQKWYQAYDEALRVPLIISNEQLFPVPASVHSVTSHVDLLPTLLGLAGLDPDHLHEEVARGHSDARELVGRNLQQLVLGKATAVADPIYFMTDDDPSRGLNQENVFGVAYDSVIQPNHIETVIVEIAGEVWKYSRYFDNPQFWSDPEPLVGPARDVVVTVDDTPIDIPGAHQVAATKRVKFTPEADEFEMYNVTQDPMELHNLSGVPAYAAMEAHLARLLEEQREIKRLRPVSGVVPGQP
jgi:choline-sulfatase